METQPPRSAKLAFKLLLIGLAYNTSPVFLQAQSSDSWSERPMQGSAQVPFAQMVHNEPAKAAAESTVAASSDSPIYLAQNQERPMPGSAEVPFSQLGPDETGLLLAQPATLPRAAILSTTSKAAPPPYLKSQPSKNIRQARRVRIVPAHSKTLNIVGTVLSDSTASTTLSRSRVPTAS